MNYLVKALSVYAIAAFTFAVTPLQARAQPTQVQSSLVGSETDFPWDQAKKLMMREFSARNFRPSSISGYQLDAPGKASVFVHFQGGGTVRMPFYFLTTDSGRKWFLVLETERSAPPIAVE